MAKKSSELRKLQSTKSHYYKVIKKNTKGEKASQKIKLMKFDPVIKQYALFEEGKLSK